MNSFEELMKRFYQEKKWEDEQFIPDFNSLAPVRDRPRPPGRLVFIGKLAASTAAVAITAIFIWKAVQPAGSKSHPVTTGIRSGGSYAAATTDRLLNTGNAQTYIWHWKSPTDGLLELHDKGFNHKKTLQ
jgi:hypothetical protein